MGPSSTLWEWGLLSVSIVLLLCSVQEKVTDGKSTGTTSLEESVYTQNGGNSINAKLKYDKKGGKFSSSQSGVSSGKQSSSLYPASGLSYYNAYGYPSTGNQTFMTGAGSGTGEVSKRYSYSPAFTGTVFERNSKDFSHRTANSMPMSMAASTNLGNFIGPQQSKDGSDFGEMASASGSQGWGSGGQQQGWGKSGGGGGGGGGGWGGGGMSSGGGGYGGQGGQGGGGGGGWGGQMMGGGGGGGWGGQMMGGGGGGWGGQMMGGGGGWGGQMMGGWGGQMMGGGGGWGGGGGGGGWMPMMMGGWGGGGGGGWMPMMMGWGGGGGGGGGGMAGPLQKLESVITTALGVIALIGLLQLLSNLLMLFIRTTTTTTTFRTTNFPFPGRRRRETFKYPGTTDDAGSDYSLERINRITMLVLPSLNVIGHALDGRVPLACTHREVCSVNSILVKEMGWQGRSIGSKLSTAISSFLKQLDKSGSIEKLVSKASLAGRSGKDCSVEYPICKAIGKKGPSTLPLLLHPEQIAEITRTSQVGHTTPPPFSLNYGTSTSPTDTSTPTTSP